MFILGKMLKYTCWLVSGIFFYHFYLVMRKDKPEEGFGASDAFLNYAYMAKDFYHFIRDLLTKPPVNSLLMERPPVPQGYQQMKTLVLNVSGTLTHSEYKVSHAIPSSTGISTAVLSPWLGLTSQTQPYPWHFKGSAKGEVRSGLGLNL